MSDEPQHGGRHVMDTRTGIIHRSQFVRANSDTDEATWCGLHMQRKHWVAMLHKPIDCMECLSVGA